jgi:colicin import membrane protein
VNYVVADEPGGAWPAALSLAVHGVLFTLLFLGLHWQSKHPDAVVVELWSQLPEFEEPQPAVPPKDEPKPEPRPQPPAKAEARVSKPDIAVEREKKPAKKREEPPLKFDTTQRIKEQLAQEQRALAARERQDVLRQFAQPAAPATPDATYIDKIRTKIKLNIVIPPDIKGNPEAVFDVVQLPTGEVLSAHLRTSSGHRTYDDAVERAILKSSPLPRPDRPEQFRRELTLKFRPQE